MMYKRVRYIRRRRGQNMWHYLRQFSLSKRRFWFLGLLIFFFTFVAGSSGFYAQIRLWREAQSLQKAIDLEKKKKIWLQKEVQSLTNDLTRIEKEARQVHGMGAPDEVIIKVQQ